MEGISILPPKKESPLGHFWLFDQGFTAEAFAPKTDILVQ